MFPAALANRALLRCLCPALLLGLGGPAQAEQRLDRLGDPLPPGAVARLGTLRLRHDGSARSVAFSPDGKALVSGGGDGTVRLWEVETGKERRRWRPGGDVRMVAFAPDGKLIAALTGEGVLLYSAVSGRQLDRFGGQTSALAFSPDGEVLVIVQDGTVVGWGLASGARLFEWPAVGECGVAYSPDGKLLAVANSEGVCLRNTTTGRIVNKLAMSALPALAFSPDGARLAAGSVTGELCLWDVSSGKLLRSIDMTGRTAQGIVFNADGKTVAFRGWLNHNVYIADLRTGSYESVPQGARTSPLHGLAYSPDGKRLATASADGRVRLWDVATWKELTVRGGAEWKNALGDEAALPPGRVVSPGGAWHQFDARVSTAAFSPDGKLLAVMLEHGQWAGLVLLDVASKKELRRYPPLPAGGRKIAFSPDSASVAVVSNKHLVIWCVKSGRKLHPFVSHPDGVADFTFSRDGKAIAVAGKGGNGLGATVRVWELAQKRERHAPLRHEGAVGSLCYPPGGKVLATARAGAVHYWDGQTGKALKTVKIPGEAPVLAPDGQVMAYEEGGMLRWRQVQGDVDVLSLGREIEDWVFSPNGKLLATSARNEGLRLWDVSTRKGRPFFAGRAPERPLCFSPDGKMLLTQPLGRPFSFVRGSPEKRSLRAWHLALDGKPGAGPGHRDEITCLAHAPDGKLVVSGSADRLLRVWETRTGKEVCCYSEHRQRVMGVTFSSDGKDVTSVDSSGAVHRWGPARGERRQRFHVRRQQPHEEAPAVSFAFSKDGTLLFVAQLTANVEVWEVATGKRLGTLRGWHPEVPEVSVSPDGNLVASGGLEVRFWSAASGKELHRITPDDKTPFGWVTFSPDGKALAGATRSGLIVLWEVATKRELLRLRPPGPIEALAFAPDGRTLFSGGQALCVWDVATGKELGRLTGLSAPLSALAVAPDGKSLVAGDQDGAVMVWERWPAPWRPWRTQRLSAGEELALWADLSTNDPKRAQRALLQFGAAPARALALLRKRVRPAPLGDAARMARWIADLDSDEFEEREQARVALEKQGERAERPLREALAGRPSLEARLRMEALLFRIESADTSPESLLALRATTLLERIGTDHAKKYLSELARGAPEARLTREAKASFLRLQRWPVVP
jgi:WD40 repeat protein